MQAAEPVRLSIADAAAQLGVSRDTVRRKLKRGQLTGRRDNYGRWWIELPAEAMSSVPMQRAAYAPTPEPSALLLEELRSQVSRLRTDLEAAHARENAEMEASRAALARVSVLEALLEAERARVEEWKAVADRFAAQTEQVLAAQARRSWWPWRRRA